MEENINISEKIDRYVLGQMSEEEKAAFEAVLSSDP
jgi:anti-sigma factor RsiW